MSKDISANEIKNTKKRDLYLSLLFDGIGYLSYAVPFLGEISDFIWAPIAGLILLKMYKNTVGIVGGITVFIEEIMPGLDFIPTFTLTWVYTYWIKNKE